MAKYDWNKLEQEYILGDYKSVSAFLKEKGINPTGNTNKQTKGWNNKKAKKEQKRGNKTIEKVIEKQSTEDAKTIITINDVANKLLEKVLKATSELNIHTDMFGNQHKGTIDRGDVKKLTSALKDLRDIIPVKPEEESEDNSFIEALSGKVEDIWDEEE